MKLNLNFSLILIITVLMLNNISCTFIKNLMQKKTNRRAANKNKDFTPEDKKIIIETHNELRNQIATQTNKIGPKLPFATNIVQAYYSMDLHEKAQKWADGKKFMHSSSSYRKQPDFHCGENLYMSMSSGSVPKKDWKKAIMAWWGEIKDMGGKSVDSFASGGPVTGHFTQLIWAHSYIIGCGYVMFTKGGWDTQIHVCQYGMVGNIMGMPIYTKSPGGKKECKCTGSLVCENSDYPGLCCEKSKCKKSIIDWSGKPYAGTNPKMNFVR